MHLPRLFRTLLCLVPLALAPGCGKVEIPDEVHGIIARWAAATERLDHAGYARCEAWPKEPAVFRDIYRDEFFTGMHIRTVTAVRRDEVATDFRGHRHITVNAVFTGAVVNRRTGKRSGAVRGDVDFMLFLDGPREKDGWLMGNRTIFRDDGVK